MCGRITNSMTWKEIHDLYEIVYDDDYNEDWDRDREDWDSRVAAEASINIAPTVRIPVIYLKDGKRAVRLMRWGLVPSWSKVIDPKYINNNAKSETVHEKASFRAAWKAPRRCIIPASSFFEWKKLDAKGKIKQPYAVGMGNRQPMSFAGLWEESNPKEGPTISCTVITTAPNELMAGIHDRMPVMIGDEDIACWLGETPLPLEEATSLLKPFDPARMTAWTVSKDVGQVRNQGRRLLEPVAA